MSDFDTRRVGEIAVLEEQIKSLQEQVNKFRQIAEKWEPRVSSEIVAPNNDGKVILQFGGKTIAATFTSSYITSMDLTSATTNVVETLCQSLVAERLRDVVRPEVERLMNNAASLLQVGKW